MIFLIIFIIKLIKGCEFSYSNKNSFGNKFKINNNLNDNLINKNNLIIESDI